MSIGKISSSNLAGGKSASFGTEFQSTIELEYLVIGGAGGGGTGDGTPNGGASATAGTANRGGGGGGGGFSGSNVVGKAGGSGIVIIKEPFVGSSCWDLRQVFRQIQAGEWAS